MLLWSYFTAVATDPGRVPPGWHPFADEEVCLHMAGHSYLLQALYCEPDMHVQPICLPMTDDLDLIVPG